MREGESWGHLEDAGSREYGGPGHCGCQLENKSNRPIADLKRFAANLVVGTSCLYGAALASLRS